MFLAGTLKSVLLASSEEDETESRVTMSPEKVRRRVLQAYRRLTLRIWFMVVTANRMKVEKYGERPLKSDVKVEATYLPEAKGPEKPRRREDMTGVGKPIPPTAKPYPIDRAVCRHQHENQATALKAAGGRNHILATGEL